MKNFFKIIFLSVALQIHAAGEQETVKYNSHGLRYIWNTRTVKLNQVSKTKFNYFCKGISRGPNLPLLWKLVPS